MNVLFEEATLKIVRSGTINELVGSGLVIGELIRDAVPSYNAATHKLVEKSTREGDNLRIGWTVTALSQSELDAKAAATALAEAKATATAEVAKASEEIDKARDLSELKAVITKQFAAFKELLNVK